MAVESYEKLVGDLKKLRLSAMTEMLDSYVKQAASNSLSYIVNSGLKVPWIPV